MLNETAIISLDYNIIKYIEKNYHEIETGFLYFFSLGKISDMVCDILIMEEREATLEKIDEIHKANKKAIVWTVNKKESMNKFLNSEVDGIITDYILKIKSEIENRKNRNDFEIIIDNIFE